MFTKISIAVVYSLKFGHEITHKKNCQQSRRPCRQLKDVSDLCAQPLEHLCYSKFAWFCCIVSSSIFSSGIRSKTMLSKNICDACSNKLPKG